MMALLAVFLSSHVPVEPDEDHEVVVYNELLQAGFCMTCGKPVTCDRETGIWSHNRGRGV